MSRLTVPLFLQFLGAWDKDTHQLWAIYTGLNQELGPLTSLSAAAEIYQAAEDNARRLEKLRDERIHNRAHKKKLKQLKRKFGKDIPERFLLPEEERLKKLTRLKQQRNREKQEKRQKERRRKSEAKLRALKIQMNRNKKQ